MITLNLSSGILLRRKVLMLTRLVLEPALVLCLQEVKTDLVHQVGCMVLVHLDCVGTLVLATETPLEGHIIIVV